MGDCPLPSQNPSPRFMKKSEGAKASEGEDGFDMISNLPDDLLQKILSDIPTTEEITRTSILSRRWRYLWTLVPSIDIDYTRGPDPDNNRFKEFVDWVLLNKSIDLDSFRLQCFRSCYNMSTIREWIHLTVMRKVKLLDLTFCPRGESHVELPHSLVTCDSLEVLKLDFLLNYLSLPKITGFPALRVLELNQVKLETSDSVKKFLESCPLLEDLSLIHCEADSPVISCLKLKYLRIQQQSIHDLEPAKICCPKLEFLELRGQVAKEFLFENLYSLKKAVIHLDSVCVVEAPVFNYLAGISHVEYLSISLYSIGQYFHPEVDAPISLPNLKTLEIIADEDQIHALIQILKCVPDLDSLHLIIPKYVHRLDNLNLEEAETINILTRHLKKVEFLEFDEEKPKLDIAHALLEHGNLLEEMVFSWDCDEAKFHERSMKTMNQMSNIHKASSTVKLRAVFNPTQAN